MGLDSGYQLARALDRLRGHAGAIFPALDGLDVLLGGQFDMASLQDALDLLGQINGFTSEVAADVNTAIDQINTLKAQLQAAGIDQALLDQVVTGLSATRDSLQATASAFPPPDAPADPGAPGTDPLPPDPVP